MRIFLALLLFVISAVAFADDAVSAKIKSGDLITVYVEGVKEYCGEYTVSTDGTISGPGFGRVKVGGKTLPEAESLVRSKVAALVKSPYVRLTLKKQREEFVYVTGAMVNGGMIPFEQGMDLRQLVTTARFVDPPDQMIATLFRNGAQVAAVRVAEMLSVATKEGKIKLQAHDVVAVSPEPTTRVWVVGLVQRPGEMKVPVGSNAAMAIAQAGGIAEQFRGDQEIRVVLRRGPETTQLNMDAGAADRLPALESGDTIMVELPPQVRVTVGGEVLRPGNVGLRAGELINAAIAKAGGTTPLATLLDVIVIRNGETFVVDATQPYTIGKDKSPKLENGDVILVRRNDRIVVVMGEVKNPGARVLADFREYRVSDLLGESMGVTNRGSNVHIYLGRADKNGKLVVSQIRFDRYLKSGAASDNPLVQPGDIIFVGERKDNALAVISQQLINAFYIVNIFRR
jgi:protein involved in polysaccharide export with SLBB domain